VDEAAAALSVSRRTLYRWIRAGRLPAQRRAGALLVPRSALPVAGAAPGLLGVRELFADTPDFADTLLDVYRSRRGERPRRVPALGGRR
jgi:excisionase family DNA binding protein